MLEVATAYGTDNHADTDGTAFAGGPVTCVYSEIFGNNDGAFSGDDAAGAGNYDAAYVEGNDLGTGYGQGGDSSTAAAAEITSPHALRPRPIAETCSLISRPCSELTGSGAGAPGTGRNASSPGDHPKNREISP